MNKLQSLIKLVITFSLTILLVSCNTGIKKGTITHKEFVPAHTYTYTTTIIVGKVCVPQVNVMSMPDTYKIKIEKDQEKNTLEITETQWDNVTIGDFFAKEKP